MSEQIQMKWTAKRILRFLSQHADELDKMGVIKIGLFGSYVRDEQHADSDVDFLVEIRDFNWTSWMDVWNWLEDQLGLSVDLVPIHTLRDELRPVVMHEVRYNLDVDALI